MRIPEGLNVALNFSLLEAIFSRRSRRFGLGMEITEGTLKYRSRFDPIPLSELEEAFLIWAGTGVTGLSLGDLPRSGISWLFQWTGRSWPCSCNSHSTELFYTNDRGLYMIKLFDLMPEPGEVAIFQNKSDEERLERILQLFKRSQIKLEDTRADLPKGEPGLFDFNAWNTNKPGTTLFIPVTNTTVEYMVLLFIYFGSKYGFNIIDELNGGRSCGLDKWIAKGYIKKDVQMSLFDLELRVLTTLNVEQAFICQNMNLALQALGLGGWAFTGLLPHYALGVDPSYRGLGFRFITPEKTLRSLKNPVPVGRDGVFEALCPPYVKDMNEAVDKFLRMRGEFWREGNPYPYRNPGEILKDEYHPSEERIQIVKDFCTYVYENYGRFPAFLDPMFVRLVFQAHHLDLEFYDKHYIYGTYADTHKNHFKLWHPELAHLFE
ncbi:MAG: hypothetical protein KatS3mg078_2378 [Deltaproteobacteria bacterium]|nr:MAG: hypothetical protein KatS3mg078_2378 [Deltaproteobacteria bacterium]